MSKLLALGLACGLVALSSNAFAAKKGFKIAELEGVDSTPTSAATGTALFTYDTDSKRFCGKVTFTPLSGDVQTANFYTGNDTVAKVIPPGTGKSPINVNVVLSADELTALEGGGIYMNLKTVLSPDGEINGVLEEDDAVPEQTCDANISDGGLSDATTGTSSGTSGDNTSGGTSGESSSGTSGTSDDKETPKKPAKAESGCATSPDGSNGGGLAVAGLVALGLALATRGRGRRR